LPSVHPTGRNRAWPVQGRVVHQHIDGAPLRQHLIEGHLQAATLAHGPAEHHHFGFGGKFLPGVHERLLVDIEYSDAVAITRESPRRGKPNAAGAARHDCNWPGSHVSSSIAAVKDTQS
jgi:hypothetical protein